MAYIVHGRGKSWEVRESHATKQGPRSRTLATFAVLTPQVVEHAQRRATKPILATELEKSANRVGAPVAGSESDRAARILLEQLDCGNAPRPVLGRLLAKALAVNSGTVSDAAQSAAAWVGTSADDRAAVLCDLLLLVDNLPLSDRDTGRRFPRLESVTT